MKEQGVAFPSEAAHSLSTMVAAASALDSAAMVVSNEDIKNRIRHFELEMRRMIASAATGVGE